MKFDNYKLHKDNLIFKPTNRGIIDSGTVLNHSVYCNDESFRPTLEDMYALRAKMDKTKAAIFLDDLWFPMACIGYSPPTDPIPTTFTKNHPKVLIVGGKNDLRTPEKWAIEMAKQLNSFYVSSDHPGHTIIFGKEEGFNNCADRIATHFLVKNELPQGGATSVCI